MHLAAGSEHDPEGVITENSLNRARMMEKRLGKLVSMREDLPEARVHGDPDAEIAIFGYGSNRGPIVEALCWSHGRRKFFELADIAANARRIASGVP